MQVRRRAVPLFVAALATSLAVPVGLGTAAAVLNGSPALAAQPTPNHATLVPAVPRNNLPRINNGEIWDMEVVGNRVFIAGSFTSLTANGYGCQPALPLASYNYETGPIDTHVPPHLRRWRERGRGIP